MIISALFSELAAGISGRFETGPLNSMPDEHALEEAAAGSEATSVEPRADANKTISWFGAEGIFGYRPRPWFADGQIQEQLHLNPLHFQHLREVYVEHYAEFAENLVRILNQKDTDLERATKLNQARQDFVRKVAAAYDNLVDDDTLRTRFEQLHLQFQGLNAFSNPTVEERLELTAEHSQEIGELAASVDQALLRATESEESSEQISEEIRQVWSDRDQEVRRILGRTRYATWEEMTGQRHEFSPEAYLSRLEDPPNATALSDQPREAASLRE